MEPPMRHHYIPCFYTKRWAGSDRKLCEFSRPHSKVKAKRVAPAGTGYADDLYAIPRTSTDRKHLIEKQFMGSIDQRANDVLVKIETGRIASLTSDERICWATFLISIMQRSPDKVEEFGFRTTDVFQTVLARMRDTYPSRRKVEDPETFDELLEQAHETGYFERAKILLLQSAIMLPRAVHLICSFRWEIIIFGAYSHKLLTSDKPIIASNGLKQTGAYLAIPIGPRKLFLATRNEETRRDLLVDTRLADNSNNSVVRRAVRFVYGSDSTAVRFMLSSSLARVVRSRAAAVFVFAAGG